MAHEGVPMVVIQRQLGHAHLGITSVYLQGIDNAEIIDAVHHRPAPVIPASAGLRTPRSGDRRTEEHAHPRGRPRRSLPSTPSAPTGDRFAAGVAFVASAPPGAPPVGCDHPAIRGAVIAFVTERSCRWPTWLLPPGRLQTSIGDVGE
jgi:hypothetical protein